MQSKRDGLIPVADVLSDLNGPVAASELKKIKIAWPGLNYSTGKGVLILHPSTPAIPPAERLQLAG